MRQTIVSPALENVYRTWHFAPAVAANGLIFCSGIIGTSPDGKKPLSSGLDGAQATLSDDEAAPISAMMAVRDPEAQFETAFGAPERNGI